MSYQLSAGSCQRLHRSTDNGDAVLSEPHTLQILSIKQVNSTTANHQDRYRIIISDGIHYMQAMLATQLNQYVQDKQIQRYSVIAVEKMTSNPLQGKHLIIILSLKVLGTLEDKIGDPKQIPSEGTTPIPNSTAVTPVPGDLTATTIKAPMQQFNQPVQSTQLSAREPRANNTVYPIEALSPYQNNWTIKARVTQKSDIRTWSNSKGEGKLFSVTLMDESGEIKATGFNDVVDAFYDKLQEGKVYYFSKARVNLAKKKFSTLTNDYELGFERSTTVEECHEASNVPAIRFNFVPLKDLAQLQKDSICDVIGIVKESGEVTEITTRQSRPLQKRELTLVDKSGFSVRLTLWGKQAQQYSAPDYPVIAFKGVKVGDYGGRSLSMFSSSTMHMNPEIEECYHLRGWYDSGGAANNFVTHSTPLSGPVSGTFNRSEVIPLQEVKRQQLGMNDKTDFFSTKATIMHIKADNLWYPACPTQNCNKKVTEINGNWRCEKCDQSFETPEYRYIMSLAAADWSGQAWLQGFNDVGLAVFDIPANELAQIKENDEARFNGIVHRANCQTFNFMCKAKQDSYNDQVRIRYGISRMIPLDYKEEMKALIDLLNSPWAQ